MLRVRGLHARYGTDGPWVLDGLDLDLVSGRSVAVVGSSGAGKSTLANVLLRFLPYEGGSITLDGAPVSELAGDDYRRIVGLVSQDAYIFDTTLEENLRLARRDATPAQLRDALDRARLLEWITGLPDGLDTRVGAHGAEISGGQRQRLALARALLADFPVLVVDEPGEHLDIAAADALVADLLDTQSDAGNAADHSPARRAASRRRDHRARPWPSARARQPRRADHRGWSVRPHVGA